MEQALPRSALELLWRSLAERTDTAVLEALRGELAERRTQALSVQDMSITVSALQELDGVLVARYAARS